MAQDDGNLKVIISRIQQRRGLKQDLPQPLRPGEIGFSTDSQQVYIGADTEDARASVRNRTVNLENTLGASVRTTSLANTQIIKFTVPHNRWPAGSDSFDGVSKSKSWLANANITSYSGVLDENGNAVTRTVFDPLVSASDFINQTNSGRKFNADDVTVLIDGVKLSGDRSGTSVLVNAAYDYNFISGSNADSDHQLYFRTAPENSQDVALTYYSNTHIYHAISNVIITAGASVSGFHTDQSIPPYREITSDLIYLNPEVGTGYIGLERKHVDIVAEGTGIPNISSLSLANIVIAKDPTDPALYDADGVYSGTGNVISTVSQDLNDLSNTTVTFETQFENLIFTELSTASSGQNGYVYLEGENNSIIAPANADPLYYHRKLLPISATSAGKTFTTKIDANSFFTARNVTSAAINPLSNSVTLTGANISGITDGDHLYVIDTGGSNLDGNVFSVSSEPVGTAIVLTSTDANANIAEWAQEVITTGVSFVNWGDSNVGSKVQLFSTSHALPVSSTDLVLDTTVGDNIAATIITANTSNVGPHTFYLDTPNATITTNIVGKWQPVLLDVSLGDGLTVSPGYVLDLSGSNNSTTLNTAISTIEGKQIWLNASLKPDINDEIYLTSDDSRQYLLFNDPQDSISTWSNLGITAGRYTRAAHTVKSKLENWLYKLSTDEKINVITGVFSNEVYQTDTNVVDAINKWDIDLNPSTNEILFASSDEAGNFATLINRLYFKSSNPDRRGLLNLSTNIEMLTTSALESGQAETVYAQPLQLEIGSNANVVLTDLSSDTSSYDTLFVDYSIVGSTADGIDTSITRYYNRVGTLTYQGNPFSTNDGNGNVDGSVIIHDVSSESFDIDGNANAYYSGGLTFSGSIANGIVSIQVTNSLDPTTSNIVMKYTVRKWKSQ